MTPPAPNAELGLLELPGEPGTWIWAFTCRKPACDCRSVVVLAAQGDRAQMLERGRPVAEAWLGEGSYAEVAQGLTDVTSFVIELDTRALFPTVGEVPLDVSAHPEVQRLADRLDDDALDAMARLWHLGKGQPLPPVPGQNGAKIVLDGWHPGSKVVWWDVHPALRGDLYVLGDGVFEALEHYCAKSNCTCNEVSVTFDVLIPRGELSPGHVQFDGERATMHPLKERFRPTLSKLWAAYCKRCPDYRQRLARRSASMHGLAGQIEAPAPKVKVGRNDTCPCGSGKKYKKCCGVAAP